MKRFLTYEQMTGLITPFLPKLEEEKFDEVVAIVRGGMTAAQFIAKRLGLPVGVYYPSNADYESPRLLTQRSKSRKLLFVEDLVALGRTYKELEFIMRLLQRENKQYSFKFMPILVDAAYSEDFEYQCLKTSDWIVFPYEECDKMTEGDRGFFRDNTTVYGEQNG